MRVIIAVLVAIISVLLILFFLVLEINSNFFPPEVIEVLYKIEITKVVPSLLSQENIGSYLEVLTGIVALLYPISLSIITDAKGDYFNSKEATPVVFNHWTYKSLKFILGFLITTLVLSFFTVLTTFWLIFICVGMICSLGMLFFYFKHLQRVIEDFSELVRVKEKKNIETILRNE